MGYADEVSAMVDADELSGSYSKDMELVTDADNVENGTHLSQVGLSSSMSGMMSGWDRYPGALKVMDHHPWNPAPPSVAL